MRRSLLVTDVDDADPLLDASVENRDNMTTGESDDGVDTFGLESPGDDLSAVNLRHVTTLLEDGVQSQVDTPGKRLDLSYGQERPRRKGLVAGREMFDRKDFASVGKGNLLLGYDTGETK